MSPKDSVDPLIDQEALATIKTRQGINKRGVEIQATYRLNNAPGAPLGTSKAARDQARFSQPVCSKDTSDQLYPIPRVSQVCISTKSCRVTDAPVLNSEGRSIRKRAGSVWRVAGGRSA